jgi:ribose/xylose/arabinose/galactoside ABC-type transport system permease subunit
MTAKSLTSMRSLMRDSKIPPVYAILVVVFVAAIVLDAIFGRGQITSSTILTNMVVRSVALGIVAMGQTFVMLPLRLICRWRISSA